MAVQLHIGSGPENSVHRRAGRPAQSIGSAGPARASDRTGLIAPEPVKWLLRGRRRRGAHFAADLFADPAWDILLDLFEAELEQRRVSVTSVCIASQVPPTTGLRWLQTLEHKGLVVRNADPLDARRFFVELTPSARTALRRWFAETFADARIG